MRRLARIIAAVLPASVVVWALACSHGPTGPTATSTSPTTPSQLATYTATVVETEVKELQFALGSTDLSVGENRLVFGLIDPETGPIRDVQVELSTFRLTSLGREGPVQTMVGVFRRWPVAPSGLYTAHMFFDKAGTWDISVVATSLSGASRSVSIRIQVNETSMTPSVGTSAPRSRSKTMSDVGSLQELTTDRRPESALYETNIANAIEMNRPVLVLFATPAYCQTATCGPQIEVVKELRDRFKDRMSFVHVDTYDNPHEIQGDLSRGVVSPTVKEWGLSSEPWTFIIDDLGLVSAKFEAFTTREELERAILNVLR